MGANQDQPLHSCTPLQQPPRACQPSQQSMVSANHQQRSTTVNSGNHCGCRDARRPQDRGWTYHARHPDPIPNTLAAENHAYQPPRGKDWPAAATGQGLASSAQHSRERDGPHGRVIAEKGRRSAARTAAHACADVLRNTFIMNNQCLCADDWEEIAGHCVSGNV